MKKILFLCTGNSCRSIMAEAILNHYGGDRVAGYSAGSFPTGKVHPLSIETLKLNGINTSECRSKSWDEFIDMHTDILVTTCDSIAGESCPIFPGSPIKLHWSIPDPGKLNGSQGEVKAEFMRVYAMLERRINDLINLPLEAMEMDELQKKLGAIGDQHE